MAEIFISYQRSDRDYAQRLADRLKLLELDIWYDRLLRPSEAWRRATKIELDRAKLILTLWSPKANKSDWVTYEAEVAYRTDRLVSVRIEPCDLLPPFSEQQAVDLIEWDGDPEAEPYLELVEIVGEKLQRAELKEFAIYRRFRKRNPAVDSKRRLRHYTFRDMMAICDQLRDSVRAFDPDAIFCFDSRGGLWAEMFFDYLTYRIPVIVGYRLKSTGPRKSDLGFCEYARLETSRWHLYIPPVLAALPKNTKVLFVDDYSRTGDTCVALHRHMIDELGWESTSFRTLTLITSPEASAREHGPDIPGVVEQAEIVDLFYMFRR